MFPNKPAVDSLSLFLFFLFLFFFFFFFFCDAGKKAFYCLPGRMSNTIPHTSPLLCFEVQAQCNIRNQQKFTHESAPALQLWTSTRLSQRQLQRDRVQRQKVTGSFLQSARSREESDTRGSDVRSSLSPLSKATRAQGGRQRVKKRR